MGDWIFNKILLFRVVGGERCSTRGRKMILRPNFYPLCFFRWIKITCIGNTTHCNEYYNKLHRGPAKISKLSFYTVNWFLNLSGFIKLEIGYKVRKFPSRRDWLLTTAPSPRRSLSLSLSLG